MKLNKWKYTLVIFLKVRRPNFLISRLWVGLQSLRVTNCFIIYKTRETYKKRCITVDNKVRCKLLDNAANRSHDDYFATPFAILWTTVPGHEEQSVRLCDMGLYKVMRSLMLGRSSKLYLIIWDENHFCRVKPKQNFPKMSFLFWFPLGKIVFWNNRLSKFH